MSSPHVGSIYIPADGPRDANIMVVGEAGGKDEEKSHPPRPFIGKAGELINRYMRDYVGFPRERIFYTNLSKFRPEKNKFEFLLGTPELEAGIAELKQEIIDVNPNVVVAAGAWPLYFLTGRTNDKGEQGTGIMNWRGSVIPSTLVPGKKVLCSMHPAFLIRNWGWHPVFRLDLQRLVEESTFPEIRSIQYETFIEPSPSDLSQLVHEMSRADWLTVDIENFTNRELACVGFADSEKRALCITFATPDWLEAIREIFEGPAKKIFQFGAYDINYMSKFYRIVVKNYAFDTYVAAASVTPEFPRALDFLTSIYTPMPYYKEDRKSWKKTGNLRILWEYNCKDVIGDFIVAMGQMKELREKFGRDIRPVMPQ